MSKLSFESGEGQRSDELDALGALPSCASETSIPGYLLLSEATRQLALGMFGGKGKPSLEPAILDEAGPSVSYGPRMEAARAEMYKAVTTGRLAVVTFLPETGESLGLDDPLPLRRFDVTPAILQTFIRSRGGLSDRPWLFTSAYRMGAAHLPGLTQALNATGLMVEAGDFKRWYELVRAKGRWPSQIGRKRRGPGAPMKQSQGLINAIEARLNDGRWTGSAGIAALHRSLATTFGQETPSDDTLARLVRRMMLVSGDVRLRLKPRRKPQVR